MKGDFVGQVVASMFWLNAGETTTLPWFGRTVKTITRDEMTLLHAEWEAKRRGGKVV